MPLPWTWIQRDSGAPAGINFSYYGCFAFGKFWIPLQNGAGVSVSDDGIAWGTVNVGQGLNTVWRVKLVNGLLYAIGLGGFAARSADGVTWDTCTTGTTQAIYDIADGGSRYIYCGTGGVVRYSTNADLSGSAAVTGTNTSDVYYGIEIVGSVYRIAGTYNVATPGMVTLTSSSGTSWSRTLSSTLSPLRFICKVGDFWFRGGVEYNTSNSPALWRSNDGVSWVAVPLPAEYAGYPLVMAYIAGRYIIAGTTGSAAFSYDGVTFEVFNPGFSETAAIRGLFEGEQTVVMSAGSSAGGIELRTAFIEPQRFFGTVRDKTGALVSRKVLAIREATDVVVHAAMSDPTTGAYQLETPYYEPHTLVFDGEPDRNALVFSGVMPG